jgi:hypothetical protein
MRELNTNLFQLISKFHFCSINEVVKKIFLINISNISLFFRSELVEKRKTLTFINELSSRVTISMDVELMSMIIMSKKNSSTRPNS